jgi:uncharacterized protein YjbJ (UPF0337 family)
MGHSVWRSTGAKIGCMDNEIADLFLKTSSARLEQMTGFVTTCLGKLTDSQVWERHGEHENAVGNIVLHLCGNLRQLILHAVGGAPDIRVREAEFSQTGGMTASELIGLFQSTVGKVRETIDTLPHARLTEKMSPQGREISVLELIYQVVGHLQQHVGQIILLTKQMTGKDLDLTLPRPR